MFSYIKGTVEDIGENYIIVDNSNIGFHIMTSKTVISSVKINQNVKVFTHLHVREDDMSLFGFTSKDELDCFRLLINISGIGPKGALAILSTLSIDELRLAVLSEDYKVIAKANGIGAKTAQKVLIELRDKIKLDDISYMKSDDSLPTEANNDTMTEVAQALVSLGYSNVEALRAIKKVPDFGTMNVEQLLKEALKKMM